MELAELRAFCILADTLNFTRAAEALYMSQSTLSRQIGKLEEELGVSLFDRSRRDVELTPYGRVFYADAHAQVSGWETALRHMEQVREGARGSLTVGYLRDSPNTAFPALVRRLREGAPEIALTFREYGMQELTEALRQRQVDAVFSFSEGLTEPEEVDSLVLGVHPMCMVVPKDHPLASAGSVEMAQFRSDPFVIISPEVSLVGYQSVLSRCLQHGFQPRVAACADIVPSIFMLVEAGVGVANLPDSAARIAPPGVRFLPISDCREPMQTVLAWRRDNAAPALHTLVTLAQRYVQGHADAQNRTESENSTCHSAEKTV